MPRLRTWSAQIANEAHSEASQVLQAQAIMFSFKRFLDGTAPAIAGGKWTVDRSSNSVNSSQSGTGNSMTFAAGVMTLDDAEASFNTTVVGRTVVIAGATNANNNGTFTITARNSPTQIVFSNANPGAASETSSFAWSIDLGATSDFLSASTSFQWAAGAVAHSWVVFKSPDGYPSTGKSLFVLFDCNSVNPYELVIKVSTEVYTGGSTTVAPTTTASKERNLGLRQWIFQPVANSRVHATRNTLGDFAFFVSKNSAGIVDTVFKIHKTQTQRVLTGDLFPCFGYFRFKDTPGTFRANDYNIYASAEGSMTLFWINGDAIGDGGNATYGITQPRFGGAQADAMLAFDNLGNDITGEHPGWETELFSAATDKVAPRGPLVDNYLAPGGAGVAQSDEFTVAGVTEYCLVGRFWEPLDTAPLLGA